MERFKLLMVFVADSHADRVLDAARAAGATGATIIPEALGQGLRKTTGIFGLEILSPRDVLLILVEERRVKAVLEAVRQAGELDESLSTGVALVIDVEQAVGLSEHVRKLATELPVAGDRRQD